MLSPMSARVSRVASPQVHTCTRAPRSSSAVASRSAEVTRSLWCGAPKIFSRTSVRGTGLVMSVPHRLYAGRSSSAATSSIPASRQAGTRSAAGRARWEAEKASTHTSPPARSSSSRAGTAPGSAAATPFSTRNSTTRRPLGEPRRVADEPGAPGPAAGPPLSTNRCPATGSVARSVISGPVT
ncbi:hypothetical protein NKH77_20435 [Streptomyces sp. M19]